MGDFREQDAIRIILLKQSDDGQTWEPVTDPSGGGGVNLVDSVDGRLGNVVLSDLYQPLDSDLTAIAALNTTTFGRALLALADAGATRTVLGLGSAALNNTGDFDTTGAAAAAQAAAIAASQPVDSDLTAIAALVTTVFGRSLLTQASAASLFAALGGITRGGAVAAMNRNSIGM